MGPPLSQAIAEHLLDWRRLASPVPWAEVFGRTAPVAVEIGFGNGEFLVDLARAHPERDHVGIEVSWGSHARLLHRVGRDELGNVRSVLADAEVALGLLFARDSVEAVFVNHPSPWPKDRHRERRLLRPPFVALLADRMAPGARLSVLTDHAAYAEEIGTVLAGEPALAEVEPRTDALAGRTTTKYQRQALAAGASLHYFERVKVGRPATAALPPIPVGPTGLPPEAMPSLDLRGEFDGDRLMTGLASTGFRESHEGLEVVVRFLSAYRHVERDAWLVETLVLEGKLRQEIGLLVVERDGRLLVKLASLGEPKPTHGVKRSVWLLGRWLCEHHPGLDVHAETVGREAKS